MARISAKVGKRHSKRKPPEIFLDTISEKRRRGRPGAAATEIRGRADNYRWILNQVWERLWPLLSAAQTEAEVVKAFEAGASPFEREFMPVPAQLVLRVVHEPRFPKGRHAQINRLADSIAGLGRVSPRRSRDICDEQRKKERKAHRILRYEFYVVCSCGYEGHSMNLACPKCGARISNNYDI